MNALARTAQIQGRAAQAHQGPRPSWWAYPSSLRHPRFQARAERYQAARGVARRGQAARGAWYDLHLPGSESGVGNPPSERHWPGRTSEEV
eukprot:1358981-Pyramimonas_sp.AAC.1